MFGTAIPKGVRLVGRLDRSTAPALLDVLSIEADRGGDVTVDLSAAAVMDASGLEALVEAARSLAGRGRLVVIDPGPLVRSTLTGMTADGPPNLFVVDPAREALAAAG